MPMCLSVRLSGGASLGFASGIVYGPFHYLTTTKGFPNMFRNRTTTRLADDCRRKGIEFHETKHGYVMRIGGVPAEHDIRPSRSGYHADGSPRSEGGYTNSRDNSRS